MEFKFDNLPFNMLVCGMTDCGKTYFILDLLENEFKNKFNNITIICPTIEFNKTYKDRNWIKSDPNIHISSDDNMNELLSSAINIFKSEDKNTLIIIDDCANLWESKNKCTQLTGLAFSGRHIGISVWLLTQKYNAVIKDYRENCKHLVVHAFNDIGTLDQIFMENRA